MMTLGDSLQHYLVCQAQPRDSCTHWSSAISLTLSDLKCEVLYAIIAPLLNWYHAAIWVATLPVYSCTWHRFRYRISVSMYPLSWNCHDIFIYSLTHNLEFLRVYTDTWPTNLISVAIYTRPLVHLKNVDGVLKVCFIKTIRSLLSLSFYLVSTPCFSSTFSPYLPDFIRTSSPDSG